MEAIRDEDAEVAVLGAMILSATAAAHATDAGLKAEHFYRGSYRFIFKAITNLEFSGRRADTIAVIDELRQQGNLENAGGAPVINTLAQMVATTTNVAHHARIIIDLASVRRLQQATTEITEIIAEPGSAEEKMAASDRALAKALEPAGETEVVKLGDTLGPLMAELEETSQTGKKRWGLKTGFTELDTLTNGMKPGQLWILAARPGMGKSTLAQNIAENVTKKGRKVAFYSLEMSTEEIGTRLLASIGPLTYTQLQQGTTTPEMFQQAQEAQEKLKAMPLYVYDGDVVSPSRIRAQARRVQRKQGLDLVIVDYIQLMQSDAQTESRQTEVAAISRALKMMARELSVPVLALSQINRGVEHRENKRPTLSDLRDSGAIEQDADLVMLLYRDDLYDAKSEAVGMAEVIIAKQRAGETGTHKLGFIGKRSKFSNLGGGKYADAAPPSTTDLRGAF